MKNLGEIQGKVLREMVREHHYKHEYITNNHTALELAIRLALKHQVKCALADVVGRSEQLADKGRYCNDCGDYVGKGCDNKNCKDFSAN